MGGLFTNSQYVSVFFWRMAESAGLWWLDCPPITCFPPAPHQMTGPPLWTLCPTCLICPMSTFVRHSPLSHLSVHLCQMTEGLLRWPNSQLLSNLLAPLSPIVNLGRACQCAAHGLILRGPQGSLAHTWTPPAPCSSVLCVLACKGNLRGAAMSPTPNLLLPPMLFIAAFSWDLVGKLDADDGEILGAMAWLVLPALKSTGFVLFHWLQGKDNDDDDDWEAKRTRSPAR